QPPRKAVINIGGQNVAIEQAGVSGRCLPSPIPPNTIVTGSLTVGDCSSRPIQFVTTAPADRYTFDGKAGEQISVFAMITPPASSSSGLGVSLIGPNGELLSNTRTRLPNTGFFTLSTNGSYTIEIVSPVPSLGTSVIPYTVELTKLAAGCSIELS